MDSLIHLSRKLDDLEREREARCPLSLLKARVLDPSQ
jgi:hypothetical protein